MRRWGVVAVAGLLAGCATGVPVERSVVVPGGGFEAVRGEADLLVRSFVAGDAGERLELVGAVCDVTTSLYRTRLTTPSRLVVPNFGPQSPELAFVCRAEGFSGAASQRIVTRWRYPPGYWGYPGPWYGPWGGWGGWYGGSYPVSEYPDVAVPMRRE